jgi:ABC-2 type transport system permease protein
MPVVPPEIMLSKILVNGMVIGVSAVMSLWLVIEWWLQVPVAGSRLLFVGGACVYVFTVAALGVALGTVASTMAQFGLITIGDDAAFRQRYPDGKHAGVVGGC